MILGVVIACDSPQSGPLTAPEPTESAKRAREALETSLGELRRPRAVLSGLADLRDVVVAPLLLPGEAENVGPGSAILITIPGAGTFGCTANFVWEAGGTRYLGAAGHCFLPEDRSATHGPGADFDASGVTVDACFADCDGSFQTSSLVGQWVRLGRVAYARQADASGEGVGNDFGIVEIPATMHNSIRTSMPAWGGPHGSASLGLGDLGCHYGHGLLVGELFPTKARVGVGGGSTEAYWVGDFAAAFGDSGSGMQRCELGLVGLHGTSAVGVLTHLGASVDPATGEHGFVFGTTMTRAVQMASEAGLSIRLVAN